MLLFPYQCLNFSPMMIIRKCSKIKSILNKLSYCVKLLSGLNILILLNVVFILVKRISCFRHQILFYFHCPKILSFLCPLWQSFFALFFLIVNQKKRLFLSFQRVLWHNIWKGKVIILSFVIFVLLFFNFANMKKRRGLLLKLKLRP